MAESVLSIDPWGRLVEYDRSEPAFMAAVPSGPIVPPLPPEMAAGRSGRWPALLKKFLAVNRKCAGCGRKADTAHHILPVSRFPEHELDETNLISVCVPCHYSGAHGGDWKLFIPNVRERLELNRRVVAVAIAEWKSRQGK